MTTSTNQRRAFPLHRATFVAIVSMLAAFLSTTGPPAHAEPPANDAWESATEVTSVPFRTTVDTTEATTDAVRPPDMRRRVAHSVWYHINLARDQRLIFSTRGSNFDHYLTLFHAENATDAPNLWTKEARRGGSQRWPAGLLLELQGDEDYFVMISSHTGNPGGLAKLQIRRPARVSFTLGQYATYDRVDGAAVLKGTIRTNRPVTVRMEAKVRQIVDDYIVQGWGRKTIQANRKSEGWTMRVAANRPFRLGAARVPYSAVRVYDGGFFLGTFKFTRTLVTLQ